MIISCVNYRTLHVKQPDVASGVRRPAWNETPDFDVNKPSMLILWKPLIWSRSKSYSKVDWVVAFKDVKTKETTSWLVRKVVKVAYRSLHLRKLFITELKLAFKRDFTTLVTIRAVC